MSTLEVALNALGGFLWAAGFWFLIDGAVYGTDNNEELNAGLYFTTIGAAVAGIL